MNSKADPAPSDLKRFLKYAVVLVALVDLILLLSGRLGSETTTTHYEDISSVVLLGIGTVLLVLAIPRVSDVSFRRTTIILALGFAFQLAFTIIWYYTFHIAKADAMPDVGIGDFFYLGSYALWISATLPYLRRYGTLMGPRSWAILLGYSIVAAVIVIIVSDYWYGAAQDYGYTVLATVVWLSYAVVPTIVLLFVLATALLYGLEGYGKGLLSSYWFYFLIPILLIACGDIVNGFTFALSEESAPAMIDDLLYLAGYATTVAAGIAVLRSHLESVTMEPSIEQHVLKGKTIKISKGRGHIVEDPKGTLSYELFTGLLYENGSSQKRGYVISRKNPRTLREECGITDARVTWITSQPGDDCIEPSKPNMIAHSIMEFLSNARGGVVLLDGVESVLVHGDFTRVLKMLEQINDFVMQYQGYLIVPIDPKAFEDRERAMLERNFETIEVKRPA